MYTSNMRSNVRVCVYIHAKDSMLNWKGVSEYIWYLRGCVFVQSSGFKPFDDLLSVNHGRTDALPLIWSSVVKGKH